MRVLILFLVTVLVVISSSIAEVVEVVDLEPRDGVRLTVLAVVPDNPKAVAILFTGGGGKLGIERHGEIKRGGNFLVRTRQMFADNGLVALVPDVSSDRKKGRGLRAFRHTPEYTKDLKALVLFARSTYQLPVWVVGTSAGTISVANAAERLTDDARPDGLVFTASITEKSSHEAHVLDFELAKFRGPALIVHHKRDGCHVTLVEGVDDIKGKLKAASAVDVLLYDGGDPQGDNCSGRHYHGFAGIEKKVVDDISKWIIAHSPKN